MFDPEQIQTMILWLAAAGFVFVFIGGMTNQFVVYYDFTDLLWALTPYLFPLAGSLMASSLVPTGETIGSTPLAILALMAGMLGAIYGAYRTFYSSVTHNGIVLGLIVGLFKALVALLVAVLSFGFLAKIFDKNVGLEKKMKAAVFLGILWWLTSKLINGEEHYSSRAMLVPAE